MRKKKLFGERGATLVEFALASTVFFVLIFGVVEFGRALWQYNVVANAAKAGVRWAAVRGSSSGQTAATASDVHDFIVTKMYGVSEVDTVTWNPVDKKQGSVVQVVVRASYVTSTIPLIPSYTLPLRSAAQMVIMR